jgi:hypothetical protein
MELIAGRIAHDVPALAAIKLPGNLRAGPQLRLEFRDAVPGFGKCGTDLKHCGINKLRFVHHILVLLQLAIRMNSLLRSTIFRCG